MFMKPNPKRQSDGSPLAIQQMLRSTIVDYPEFVSTGDNGNINQNDTDDLLSVLSDEKSTTNGSLVSRLNYERHKRTLTKDFAQCKCNLGKPYLARIGQNLQFLTGYSATGQPPNAWKKSKSRSLILPLELMDRSDIETYQKIKDVNCWWCKHQFDGMPVGCPISYREVRVDKKVSAKLDTVRIRRLRQAIMHNRSPNTTPVAWENINQNRKYDGPIATRRALDKRMINIVKLEGKSSSRKRKFHESNRESRRVRRRRDGITPEFKLHGYFCSYPCAKAYGLSMDGVDKIALGSHFRALMSVVVKQLREEGVLSDGYPIPSIKKAPHFSILKTFGGCMDIDEFRRSTEVDNGHELTVVPDWIPIIPSGMMVFDYPVLQTSFADSYNIQLAKRFKFTSTKKREQTQLKKINDKNKLNGVKGTVPKRNGNTRANKKGKLKVMYNAPQKNQIQMCMQK